MQHFIVALTLMLLLVLSYLAWARFSHHRRWPFKSDDTHDKKQHDITQHSQPEDKRPATKFMDGAGVVIITVLVIGLFIVLIYYSIKLDMKRYQIAGDAIQKGNTGVAVAALAPEIGTGIGDVFGGITGNRFV